MSEAKNIDESLPYRLGVWLLFGVIIGMLIGFSLGHSGSYGGAIGFDRFLDWPFLLLVCTIFLVIVFKEDLTGVLNRGDIKLSWGDRSIRLRDLSSNLNEELDPIRDDVEELKKEIESVRLHSSEKQQSFPTFDPGLLQRISETHNTKPLSFRQALSEEERKTAVHKMKAALANTEFRWRSVERLAIAAGIQEDEALSLLRTELDVVLGKGITGRRIARLVTR